MIASDRPTGRSGAAGLDGVARRDVAGGHAVGERPCPRGAYVAEAVRRDAGSRRSRPRASRARGRGRSRGGRTRTATAQVRLVHGDRVGDPVAEALHDLVAVAREQLGASGSSQPLRIGEPVRRGEVVEGHDRRHPALEALVDDRLVVVERLVVESPSSARPAPTPRRSGRPLRPIACGQLDVLAPQFHELLHACPDGSWNTVGDTSSRANQVSLSTLSPSVWWPALATPQRKSAGRCGQSRDQPVAEVTAAEGSLADTSHQAPSTAISAPEPLELTAEVAAVGLLEPAVGERQPDHAVPGRADLADQRAGVVVEPVALEQGLDLGRDLGVPVARQVREAVVLDLVGEVAGHQVHEGAAGDVGRAEHLAEVPLAPGLALVETSSSKVSTPSGKCPHMITEWLHTLRVRLAIALAASVRRNPRQRAPGSRRSPWRSACPALRSITRSRPLASGDSSLLPARSPRSASYVAMPHSKMQAVTRLSSRLGQVPRLPLLLLGHPHDAVAEVVVLADDVRELVVGLVVGALPLRRR